MSAPKRKAVRCSNTLTAVKKTNIQNNMNATYFIAAGTRQASAGRVFHARPCQRTDRQEYRAVGPRDRILPGASNTIDNAGNLPDSEVFSRPEFKDGLKFQGIYGFGRDGLVRKAGRMALSMLLTSRPPVARSKAASGFQSHNGAETMTTVTTPTTPTLGNTSPLTRQQAIENALEDALHFIRTDHPGHSLCLATARTRRALSMLKQSCAEVSQAMRKQIGGAA